MASSSGFPASPPVGAVGGERSLPRPRPGDRCPILAVEALKADLELGRLEAAGPLLALERELRAAAAAASVS